LKCYKRPDDVFLIIMIRFLLFFVLLGLIGCGNRKQKLLNLVSEGNQYLSDGDYLAAINRYDAAIDLESEYASAFNNRGVAFNKLGQIEKAIDDFSRQLSLNLLFTMHY